MDESPWEILAPDGDEPAGFLHELVDHRQDERAGIIVDALTRFVGQDRADAEDAAFTSMAVFLVAAARNPRKFAARRDAVLRLVSTWSEVNTLGRLIGDHAALRLPEVAELAIVAADWIGRTWLPKLDHLPQLSNQLAFALDDFREALHVTPRPWTAAADRPPRRRSVEELRPWMVPGEILTIDLGDGFRTYAQLGTGFDVAVHDVHEPANADVLAVSEIIERPVLFNVSVNQYYPRPPWWRTVGRLPDGHPVLPQATRFRQGIGEATCYLVIDGDWDNLVPTTQQHCADLERAGVGWSPEDVEDRARCHYSGHPHPMTEHLRVRFSRSLVRVCTRLESYTMNAPGDPPQLFGPPSMLSHLAASYGPGRTDLVMVEADKATLTIRPHPLDPDDPDSPQVSGCHGLMEHRVLGRYPLRPLPDGAYEPAEPWMPTIPE